MGGGRLDAVGTERYPIGPVPQGPDAFRLERQSNMAFAVSIPSRALSEHRDLAFWMKRALEELAGLRGDPSPDAVHDVRVALRRCRSVAAAVEEIDPHPDWLEMRDGARKVFRSLGDLRDAQVMEEWAARVQPGNDPLKGALLESLAARKESANKKALSSAAKFDEKRWHELERALTARLRRIPADGDAARCLAVERLEEARELHRRALRTESPRPWHALRIGIKRFRYTMESLVPSLHEEWSDALKRVQDVLGDIHDVDVLRELMHAAQANMPAGSGADWETTMARIRQEKLEEYRQLSLGPNSVWQDWQRGFPKQDWARYAVARIAATRKCMDGKLRKSLAVRRIALKVWSQLRMCGAGEIFADLRERGVLEAVARLSGIRLEDSKKPRTKSARTFLLKSPVPPAWTFAEWERVAWSVRFQRGAEPGTGKRYSKLVAEQQARIALHAGILRLALTIYGSGVSSGAAVKMEKLPTSLLLHVSGVEESPERAASFAAAKRLLERSLGKTILVHLDPERENEHKVAEADAAVVPTIAIVR